MRSLSICLAAVSLFATSTFAEHNALLPRPQQLRYTDGTLPLDGPSIRFASKPSAEDRFAGELPAGAIAVPWAYDAFTNYVPYIEPLEPARQARWDAECEFWRAMQVRTREVLTGWKPGEPFPPVTSLRPKP